jgi:uncharacterized protein YkwD
VALALAAVLGALLWSAPPASATGKPCRLYADTKPKKISKQHARSAVLCLINRHREVNGLGRLKRDKRLQSAAQGHSGRMAGGNCLGHQCYGEASLDARLRSVGYIIAGLTRWLFGENVGFGAKARGTPRAIVDAWMASASHRANILNGGFRDAGIGFADGTLSNDHGNGGVYTVDFGFRSG